MKEILFEDKEIIVCHKKAGIPVQSARLGQKDMVSILNNYLAEKGEKVQVNVVHRLDQPVEGVIVFAKTKKAAAGLSKQIQQGSMRKIYHAVCCVESETWIKDPQNIETEVYQLTDYLVKDGKTNSSRVCCPKDKAAKKAELEFKILKINEEEGRKCLLAEIELKTGRHHQIRVQMSHAGLPLYGDQKYNQRWEEYLISGVQRGLGLCAVSLTFEHPVKGKKMTFQVEPEGEVFRRF